MSLCRSHENKHIHADFLAEFENVMGVHHSDQELVHKSAADVNSTLYLIATHGLNQLAEVQLEDKIKRVH